MKWVIEIEVPTINDLQRFNTFFREKEVHREDYSSPVKEAYLIPTEIITGIRRSE